MNSQKVRRLQNGSELSTNFLGFCSWSLLSRYVPIGKKIAFSVLVYEFLRVPDQKIKVLLLSIKMFA